MSGFRKNGNNPVMNLLKSLKDTRYLMFFLGAVTAFSTGWAAFIAAGKPSRANTTNTATVATQGTKTLHSTPTNPQAQHKQGNTLGFGEQAKAGIRASLGIALPMVGGHQLMMFLNRGNHLGKLMRGHYLTSFKFPFGVAGIHWLTGAGAIITLGGQFFLGHQLRKTVEAVQDKTVGKPLYLVEYQERDKAAAVLRDIKERNFSKIKKEDIALISKYPEICTKEKITLKPEQIEEAYRLAGSKKVRDIDPKEAALLYALAQQANASTANNTLPTGLPKRLSPQEAALLYTLMQQNQA